MGGLVLFCSFFLAILSDGLIFLLGIKVNCLLISASVSSEFLHLFHTYVLKGSCVKTLCQEVGVMPRCIRHGDFLSEHFYTPGETKAKGGGRGNSSSRCLGTTRRGPHSHRRMEGLDHWTFDMGSRWLRNRRFQLFFKSELRLKTQVLVGSLGRKDSGARSLPHTDHPFFPPEKPGCSFQEEGNQRWSRPWGHGVQSRARGDATLTTEGVRVTEDHLTVLRKTCPFLTPCPSASPAATVSDLYPLELCPANPVTTSHTRGLVSLSDRGWDSKTDMSAWPHALSSLQERILPFFFQLRKQQLLLGL